MTVALRLNKLKHLETRITALQVSMLEKRVATNNFEFDTNEIHLIGNLIIQNEIIFYIPVLFPKRVKTTIKSSLCNVCICGKEAKQVITFIQLFCGFSYVNTPVYTTSIFLS